MKTYTRLQRDAAITAWLLGAALASTGLLDSTAIAATTPAPAIATDAQSTAAAPKGVLVLSPDQRVALGLRFAPISAAQAPTLNLAGAVVVPPERQSVVAAAHPGLLSEVRVTVGDRVVGGQTLARLSSPQVIELQRESMSAQVQRDLARDTLERDERLHSEGLIPLARLRAARARLSDAEALASERRLQLQLAGVVQPAGTAPTLSALAPIMAPTSGVVIEANAVSGQRVDATTALFRIAQDSVLWLALQATAEQAAVIALGDQVSWPARGVTGKVSAIGAAVGTGQTVTVRASLDAGGDRVRPGETLQAQVRIRLPAGAQWRVPASAVTRRADRPVIFVQHPQGVRLVEVTIHGRDEAGVMIAAALQASDRVAVAGVPGLKALASEDKP